MFVKCIKGELIRQVFELGGGNSFKFGSEVQPRVEALLLPPPWKVVFGLRTPRKQYLVLALLNITTINIVLK